MLKIVTTSDSSHTLFVPEINEHYHSIHGAIQESEFVFNNCGFNFLKSDPVKIFEVGFGTGLNALLTCLNALTHNREVFYTAIENNPLPGSLIDLLNYKDLVSRDGRPIFERLHSVKWNFPEKITSNFTLLKIKCDLTADEIHGNFNLIYFDAFGPDKQPEMWTDEVFKKISEVTERNGILVTYSAKGSVQRMLCKNGFAVSLLPGPPGKRQIIRAVKI